VQHINLVESLRELQLDNNNMRVIQNLYWNQTAAVNIGGTTSEAVRIERGVRQGCVLSPLLFNVYSNKIFQRATEDRQEGININGEIINNLRYADDTVLCTTSLSDLQVLLDRVGEECERYGLKINISKTKLMTIAKQRTNADGLYLQGERIERVSRFKYLGTWINDEWNPDSEIITRIEIARQAFVKMRKFFCSRDIPLPIRCRFIKCYIWSILLYGSECWTVKAATSRRLEAFEMWVYRRMLRIPWTDKVTNATVLQRVGRERELLVTVKRKKLAYFGHILRNRKYVMQQLMIFGRIEGNRRRGRPRTTWLDNIIRWTDSSLVQLTRLADDKTGFTRMIADLR
jgi:hypothetical protein